MSFVIETDRLTKHYGSTRVVNQVSLRIAAGTVYGFLGRNGAGKSTTLKMLVGMVRPDFGTARVLGEDSSALKPETRARIAYLAEGHPLYAKLNIGQMVEFTRSFYERWDQALVDKILDHFGLSLKKVIGSLSKGQRAQVSLALAIAPDPELLIMDDPTLGLDTNVRRDFLESMIQIIQRRARTILLSSHNLSDIERVADRVGVMMDGVLRVDCPTDQFKQSVRKVIVEFGRDPPEIVALPGLVNDWAIDTRRELAVVGYGDVQQAALEALSPKRIDVHELDLEDAFIEYTRGTRRALRIFAGDSTT